MIKWMYLYFSLDVQTDQVLLMDFSSDYLWVLLSQITAAEITYMYLYQKYTNKLENVFCLINV